MADEKKAATTPKAAESPADRIAAAAMAKATSRHQGHPRAVITVAGASPAAARMQAGMTDNVAAGVRLLTDFLVDRFGDDLEALVSQPAVLDFLSTWVSDRALDLADSLLHLVQGPQVAGALPR